MHLEYSTPGEVKITMITYLKKVMNDFHKDIRVCDTSPDVDRLLQGRDKIK